MTSPPLEKADFIPDSPLVARVHRSSNAGPRRAGAVDLLVLHYTGMRSAEAAIQWLAAPQSKVSSHYVIDEAGAVIQLVPEALRAWHAGISHWQGEDDINSRSIGIEIQNPGHDLGYPDFPDEQMRAVEKLCLDILARNLIPKERVLAHSDVAPARKIDPGEKFDWARLARAGVGHWAPPASAARGPELRLGDKGDEVLVLQRRLRNYGYGIEPSGTFDVATEFVVSAFQRHFRQMRVDGRADRSTVETLDALLSGSPNAGRE
jgi:N-acetylmuramoyl-L-alanine amidase